MIGRRHDTDKGNELISMMKTLPPLITFWLYVAIPPSHSSNATGAILQHYSISHLVILSCFAPQRKCRYSMHLAKNVFGLYPKKKKTVWLKAVYVNSDILSYLLSQSQ